MKIEEDIKLDYNDVLIRPKRTVLTSRSDVNLERTIYFKTSQQTWNGIPIIAANMDTIGTIDVYKVLSNIYPEGQDSRPFPDHLPMEYGIFVGQIIDENNKPKINMDVRWEYELRGLPYE